MTALLPYLIDSLSMSIVKNGEYPQLAFKFLYALRNLLIPYIFM